MTTPPKSIKGKPESKIIHFELDQINAIKARCVKYLDAISNERTDFFGSHPDATAFIKDITGVTSIFNGLTVVPGYKLKLYSVRGMHGTVGRVVGEPSSDNMKELKTNKLRDSLNAVLQGWQIPMSSIDPMEAITGDGTTDSFMEAILLSRLFIALPSMSFRHHYSIIENSPFSDDSKAWEVYTELATWKPTCITGKSSIEIRYCTQEEQIHDLHTFNTSSCIKLNCCHFTQDSFYSSFRTEKPEFPMSRTNIREPVYKISSENSLLLGKELKEFADTMRFSF